MRFITDGCQFGRKLCCVHRELTRHVRGLHALEIVEDLPEVDAIIIPLGPGLEFNP
ncbi:MAG: hypothetical protein IH606_07945 [Burkholderiales bacterium]|nr:hypothetical protein [Burkholderiales bacterium]